MCITVAWATKKIFSPSPELEGFQKADRKSGLRSNVVEFSSITREYCDLLRDLAGRMDWLQPINQANQVNEDGRLGHWEGEEGKQGSRRSVTPLAESRGRNLQVTLGHFREIYRNVILCTSVHKRKPTSSSPQKYDP
jgi:hypothetical protein